MTLLGHDRFRAVGHDVGMMLAYALAADHPSRVTELVLAEAALPGISDAPSAIPAVNRAVEATWRAAFRGAGVAAVRWWSRTSGSTTGSEPLPRSRSGP
ncbi:hypothetical protein Ahu01nite_096010 [Winogradskya humida]|uniref:AB hydrolase-1 domain-containing protein n=2 Tax=Winogradskya humida TaxID=113566 RepID=A0ABQ4A707_9ACTN|nr:hypothetical protein Ahu01nite_096010 [Actinoplanes humidus]